MLKALEERLKVLDQALNNAKMNIQQCSDNFEAAKIQYNTVVGHHKECVYHLELAKKSCGNPLPGSPLLPATECEPEGVSHAAEERDE